MSASVAAPIDITAAPLSGKRLSKVLLVSVQRDAYPAPCTHRIPMSTPMLLAVPATIQPTIHNVIDTKYTFYGRVVNFCNQIVVRVVHLAANDLANRTPDDRETAL